MSETEINDYLSKYDEDLANNVIYRVYGMPGPIFMEKNNDTPTPEPPTPGPDYSEPFYINVRGAVTLEATSGLQMSTDKTNWTDTTATTLSSGKTYFRVASDQEVPLKPNWTEKSNSDYDIGGNINSLVKTSFENDTTCYSFSSYFNGKAKLKNAGNLILPAMTLVDHCYDQMFANCTLLTTSPKLPAITLADSCYVGMFVNCTSLTTAPTLPATTLGKWCYSNMFNGCTSLTTAPELPAMIMTHRCYGSMFNGCTSLTTAPTLPAMTLADSCYSNMFNGCTNLNYIKCLATNKTTSEYTNYWVYGVAATGTFVKDTNMSDWTTGVNGIPEGWTVENATN